MRFRKVKFKVLNSDRFTYFLVQKRAIANKYECELGEYQIPVPN